MRHFFKYVCYVQYRAACILLGGTSYSVNQQFPMFGTGRLGDLLEQHNYSWFQLHAWWLPALGGSQSEFIPWWNPNTLCVLVKLGVTVLATHSLLCVIVLWISRQWISVHNYWCYETSIEICFNSYHHELQSISVHYTLPISAFTFCVWFGS